VIVSFLSIFGIIVFVRYGVKRIIGVSCSVFAGGVKPACLMSARLARTSGKLAGPRPGQHAQA
jgi:hypothetical protein